MSITTINPANDEVLETYPRMGAEEIEATVEFFIVYNYTQLS